MRTIESLIPPECILFGVQAEDKGDILRILVDALAGADRVPDPEKLLEDVLAREEEASTALGFGCAVPHVHSEGVEKTVMAAALLAEPLDFGAEDGEPVSLVLMMAGPANRARGHLKLLSKLARFLHDPDFRERLMGAEGAEDFRRLLREREV